VFTRCTASNTIKLEQYQEMEMKPYKIPSQQWAKLSIGKEGSRMEEHSTPAPKPHTYILKSRVVVELSILSPKCVLT